MFRKEKMKGEREKDNNFSGEKPYLTSKNYHHKQGEEQLFEGVSSSTTTSHSYTNGFCLSDVASSSLPPFDHSHYPTPKTHFVDQSYMGSSDSYHRMASNGVNMDELGFAREFQKMSMGNNNHNNHNHRMIMSDVSSDVGQFHRDSDVFKMSDCNTSNVAEFSRPSIDENFGVLGGFYDNGFSGNGGGFQSSIMYRDDRGVKDEMNFRLGQRMGNLGDSLGLNSAYAVHGHQNCLINLPQDGTTHQGGVNRYYDRMPMYDANEFLGNGPISRGNEYISSGGVVPRGDVGYGNEMSYQVGSGYAPHIVGDPLQQYMLDGCKEMLSPWGSSQNLSMYKPSPNEGFVEQFGRQLPGNVGGLRSVDPSQLMYSKQALTRESVIYNSMRERMRAVEQREGNPPVALMKRAARHLEPYGYESRYIPEKGSNGVMGKNYQFPGRTKKLLGGNAMQNTRESNFELNVPLQTERGFESGARLIDPVLMQTVYNSLVEVRGNIYLMAKDQHGCRFLQKKFDEGSHEDVQLIFTEILDHVAELMMNPFGNYLIQKLLDVCNDEQRMKIVHAVTKDRGELVRISLNTHGTRVVQKLIQSLTTRKQISLIIKALEAGFLDLIKDLNGNHVVQRCLECLSSDDNKFIFDAAAKYCVEIATHRHGCCVLQRCIGYAIGEHRQKLIEKICNNGFILAQDPFGNYVVQYILERKIPSATAQLISQLEGSFVQLSTQKFSSHVVEKCLRLSEESRPRIVYELLSVPHFEQLVQDPYANYVLQVALEVTKGALYESLVAAVRPHSMLRTNPFCKKIFSRGLLKK